jgi:peptidyl-prolyl cis-trans isomerase D
MMQTLRKYMKHILWIVAVAFIATIVFSWGMGGFRNKGSEVESGIVGIINGQKIQYQQFLMLLTQDIETAKAQSGSEELSEYRIRSIRDQVWQKIIRDVLLAKEIERLNIRASAEEVVFHLRYNPPDFIRSEEQFQTEGEFDMSKYQQALSDPRNYDAWIPVENMLRNMLPIQKLQQRVLATVRVTDSEVREAYRLENEKVNAKYLFFDPNSVSLENIEITDSEIQTHYENHQEDYKEPEKRKIQYILFEGKPSKEDSTQTLNDAQDILEQIQNGADFEELAEEYSEDTGTASKGGDLGFFGRGAMLKPFEEAAFSAKVREVVGPVKTQFGLHIIQVLARKIERGETQVHARHILLKYKTSPETFDALNEKAQYLYEEITSTKGKYFAELAEEEGLSIEETPLFQNSGFIPGIGMASHISRYTFQEKIGWVSQPMTSGENIILFRISDIQKSRIKPLEEVKTTIQRILTTEKQKDRAGELCRQVWEKIDKGVDFEESASEDSLEIVETGLFSLQSFVTGVGRDASFAGTAFRLRIGEVSQPVEGDRGYYLIKTIDRVEFDEKVFEAAKESQKETLFQKKQQMAYTAWFNSLREKADIKDYRDYYFN